MDTIQISSQWYAIRWEDDSHVRFAIVAGPFAERFWAESAARTRDV